MGLNLDEILIPLFFIIMIVIITLTPFVLIWSFNTLFKLGIEYTYETYVAMLFLLLFVLYLSKPLIKVEIKEKEGYEWKGEEM